MGTNERTIVMVRHRKKPERTMAKYMEHNVKVLKPDEVVYVSDEPFTKTWKRCLEIAKEKDFEHCFMVDSDIYIINGEYVQECLNTDFYLEFEVHDKFTGPRVCGFHYYNKPTMDGMAEYMTDKDFMASKEWLEDAEWATIRRYCIENGYGEKERIGGFFKRDQTAALHDYNQYFKDIFYKYVYRSWRVTEDRAAKHIGQWEHTTDKDFFVAREGLKWGLENPLENFTQSQGLLHTDVDKAFWALGVEEKSDMVSSEEIASMKAHAEANGCILH